MDLSFNNERVAKFALRAGAALCVASLFLPHVHVVRANGEMYDVYGFEWLTTFYIVNLPMLFFFLFPLTFKYVRLNQVIVVGYLIVSFAWLTFVMMVSNINLDGDEVVLLAGRYVYIASIALTIIGLVYLPGKYLNSQKTTLAQGL